MSWSFRNQDQTQRCTDRLPDQVQDAARPAGGIGGQHRRLSGGRRRRYGWWDVCRGDRLECCEELGVDRS